jgi:hypothetical protein
MWTRREFLLSGAIAGLAPARLKTSLNSPPLVDQSPAAPTNLHIVNGTGKPVLTASDFTYLGMFKMPLDTISQVERFFNFSYAAITGRYHDGNALPNLLMMGPQYGASIQNAVDICEIAVPPLASLAKQASFATRLANAPACSVIRSWARDSVFANMTVSSNGAVPWGLHYVGNQFGNGSQLLWTYDGSYALNFQNPSLGSSVLNDDGTCTSYGPWGFNGVSAGLSSGATSGYMLDIPTSFRSATGCGPIGVGSPRHRNSAAAFSWGANLVAFTPPTIGTARNIAAIAGGNPAPSDGNGNAWAVANPQVCLFYPSSNPQARNTNVVVCGSNSPNDPFNAQLGDCASGHHQSVGNGLCGNGAGASSVSAFLENTTACVWIEGPNKQGVLFLGEMPETVSIANGFSKDYVYGGTDPGHCHYAYQGSPLCCHGQDLQPAWSATGPGAGTIVSYYWIYNPDFFIGVVRGQTQSFALTPSSSGHAYSLGGGSIAEVLSAFDYPPGASHLGQLAIGGAWYDPVGKYLFVTQVGVYGDGGHDQLPVVHVFSVNC